MYFCLLYFSPKMWGLLVCAGNADTISTLSKKCLGRVRSVKRKKKSMVAKKQIQHQSRCSKLASNILFHISCRTCRVITPDANNRPDNGRNAPTQSCRWIVTTGPTYCRRPWNIYITRLRPNTLTKITTLQLKSRTAGDGDGGQNDQKRAKKTYKSPIMLIKSPGRPRLQRRGGRVSGQETFR